MAKQQKDFLGKAQQFGQTAFSQMIEFPSVALKVTETAVKQEAGLAGDLLRNGKEHLKTLPKLRNMGDFSTLANEASNNMLNFAKGSFAVVKESHLEYKSWFENNMKTLNKIIKPKTKAKAPRKKAAPKAATVKETKAATA